MMRFMATDDELLDAYLTEVGSCPVPDQREEQRLASLAQQGDEEALHSALAEKRIAGAYLDTFGQEPYEGELRELPNVVLTPHAGSFAKEARALMESEAVENLLGYLYE